MPSKFPISKGLKQILPTLGILLTTPAFIIKHQLWKGIFDNKWVTVFSIIISVLFSLVLYDNIHERFFPSESDEGININISIGDEDENADHNIIDIEEDEKDDHVEDEDKSEATSDINKAKELLEEDHKPLFSGSMKFLLLILLQVLLYHFAVKTNNILKNKSEVVSFRNFSKAQQRMFKLMGRKWFYGLIAYVLLSIVLSIFGIGSIKDVLMFLIYGYFLGFAFLDNYLEQFDYSIKESAEKTKNHFGASTLFGIITSALIHVPINWSIDL